MGRGARRAHVVNTGPVVLRAQTIAAASAVAADAHDVARGQRHLHIKTEDGSAHAQPAINKEHAPWYSYTPAASRLTVAQTYEWRPRGRAKAVGIDWTRIIM